MSPTVSQLVIEGILEPKSVTQLDAYAAGTLFARTVGLIPAPETNHAIAQVVEEAKKAKEAGEEKVIYFNYSGHGLLDLGSYEKYYADELENFGLSDEDLQNSEKVFEDFPKPQLLKSRD
jgi:tryptophan synthase beta chain